MKAWQATTGDAERLTAGGGVGVVEVGSIARYSPEPHVIVLVGDDPPRSRSCQGRKAGEKHHLSASVEGQQKRSRPCKY